MLVFQNKETATILVYQAIPRGIKFYFYAKSSFVLFINMAAGHVNENALFEYSIILGNPGLQRGREGKGETGSGKKGGGRGGEGKGEPLPISSFPSRPR